MTKEILILIFNAVFLVNNILFLELAEGIFNVKSNKMKILAFSLINSVIGTVMLMFFGTMSALGYGIEFFVYFATVSIFYTKQSFITKMACVLYFNLHIMVSRAMITSLMSMTTGKTILELSQDVHTFWFVLILTALFCGLLTAVLLRLIPRKYFHIMGRKTDYFKLYVAMLLIANIYMVANGNVYIHEIGYKLLHLHQMIAALSWLAIIYIGIFMLVGFDIMREREISLDKDTIYKKMVEKHSLVLVEVNCTQDKLISVLRDGKQEDVAGKPYTKYIEGTIRPEMYPQDYRRLIEHESCEHIISEYNKGNDKLVADGRMLLKNDVYKWVRSSITTRKDDATGDILAVVTVTDDIHDLKENEVYFQKKSQRDQLVGAYNKIATEVLVDEYLSQNETGALFMIDLDNFKAINDNFGHLFGDEVLKEVFEKISKNFRHEDIIGRIGGDEIVVFLKKTTNTDEIELRARTICDSIRKIYTKEDISVEISCSLGIAVSPKHGTSFADLYQFADLAMYSCKKTTKDGYVIYREDLKQND